MSTLTEYAESRLKEQKDILELFPSRLDNNLIITPIKIVHEMLDALPKEIWNSQTKFLDPACKSGRYLYYIYKRLMETQSLIDEFPDEQVRGHHILQNQLFGIGVDQLTTLVSQRLLYGHLNSEYNNIKVIPNYLTIVKNKDPQFYIQAIQKEFDTMKFDVIISNPPYQDENGKGLYHKFINKAFKLKTRVLSFIVMSSWFNAKSGELGDTKQQLIKDNHLRNITDYIVASDVFPDVTIKGGVSSFVWDRDYVGKCRLVQHNRNLVEIADTTFSKYGYVIRWAKVISIIDKLYESNFKRMNILTNAFGVDFDECSIIGTGVKVINKVESVRYAEESGYIDKEDIIDKYGLVNRYKLIVGTNLGNAGKTQMDGGTKVLGTIAVLEPNEICTNTYMVAEASNSIDIVNNVKSYLQTKFVRALVLATTSGISLGNDNFKFVPMQDFTKSWNDEELYKKYNLSTEEINYIEQTIKPMN